MYQRVVYVRQTIEITRDEAAELIVDARINVPGKVDCYVREGHMLYCIFTIAAPENLEQLVEFHIDKGCPADEARSATLLSYAHANMPENILFW